MVSRGMAGLQAMMRLWIQSAVQGNAARRRVEGMRWSVGGFRDGGDRWVSTGYLPLSTHKHPFHSESHTVNKLSNKRWHTRKKTVHKSHARMQYNSPKSCAQSHSNVTFQRLKTKTPDPNLCPQTVQDLTPEWPESDLQKGSRQAVSQ